MATSPEERFEEIAQKAIEAAERVPCTIGAFVDGCQLISRRFAERGQISKNEG